jgi:hypothetical protein
MEEKRLFCGGGESLGGKWRAGLSDFWDLGEKIEVGVAGIDNEGVFHGEGRDPNVIGRNRSTLFAEVGIESGTVVGGCVGGVGGPYARLLEKLCEDSSLNIPAF